MPLTLLQYKAGRELKTLAENTEFKTVDQYTKAVEILKESVVTVPSTDGKSKRAQDLAEQTLNSTPTTIQSDKRVSAAADALTRWAKS